MMTEYTFYQIECNGKRYVGYSKNFKNRIQKRLKEKMLIELKQKIKC